MRKLFILIVISFFGFLSCEKSNATSESDKVGNYTGKTYQDSTISINLNMVNGKLMVTNYSISLDFDTNDGIPWMVYSEANQDGIEEVRNDEFTIIITNSGGLENSSLEGVLTDNKIIGNFNMNQSPTNSGETPSLSGSYEAER